MTQPFLIFVILKIIMVLIEFFIVVISDMDLEEESWSAV